MATDTVDIWTLYNFECPNCAGVTSNPWMPRRGDVLLCDGCGNEVIVGEIIEDCRPTPPRPAPCKKKKAATKKKK